MPSSANTSSGNATPRAANTIWNASDVPICARAASTWSIGRSYSAEMRPMPAFVGKSKRTAAIAVVLLFVNAADLLEVDGRISFAWSNLLAAEYLRRSFTVRIGARPGGKFATDRRRDQEMFARRTAFRLVNDRARIDLLNGLVVAGAEVGLGMFVRIVLEAFERFNKLFRIRRADGVEAVHDVLRRHVAEVLTPINVRRFLLKICVTFCGGGAACIRAPNVAPDRTDEIVNRHADGNVIATKNSTEMHLFLQAELYGSFRRVLTIGPVVTKHQHIGIGIACLGQV